MNEESIKQLLKRLDLLLSLKMKPLSEKATDQDKIQRLNAFNYTPGEIATILESTGDKISKQLYKIRKNLPDLLMVGMRTLNPSI